jgi:hypothetical protein
MVLIKRETRTPGFLSTHTYDKKDLDVNKRSTAGQKLEPSGTKTRDHTYAGMEMRTHQCRESSGYAAPAFTWVHLHE